ncbi:hypothetical protein CDEST_00093 [Colletotrichum destructivum]|uniref:Uncharacterized protein n=1 Tax=Colletotrichum destructivum TaxID=34406 RepID=A0AAX4HVN0_9PEZI|nr:hypothetical protein CDEST_00093 [Colletotrichum destructivum]
MYVSTPRRRRAGPPIPIRVRRHANSPIFAGRSPVPWSPAQPTPPSGRSADFQPFPVSPESTTTTDSDGDLSPSCFTPPVQTPWLASTFSEHGRAGTGDGSRRESVESRTGGVPETPMSTPVDGPLPVGIEMTMRMDRPDGVDAVAPSKFAGLPRSPRRRSGGGRRGLRRMPKLEGRILGLRLSDDERFDEGETLGGVIKIVDEAEASGVVKAASLEKGDDRGCDKVIEGESEAKDVWQLKTESDEREREVTGMEECRCQKRGGFVEPSPWRKCPWVTLMLLLFELFIST